MRSDPYVQTDAGGSGMAPVISAAHLFKPYRYRAAERGDMMEERKFLAEVTGRCDELGLLWYHPTMPQADRAGFPDVVIAGHGGFVIWELKSEQGRPSMAQLRWGSLLLRAPYAGYRMLRPSWFTEGSPAWQQLGHLADPHGRAR